MGVKDTGPLTWNVPIVDVHSGRPTPEFQRRWEQQRRNNDLIGAVTLGTGAPTGTPDDGAEYIDTSTTPYTFYIGKNSTWHQVSAMRFTDLTDGPLSYTGDALKLVQVNSGATGLTYSPVTITTAGQIKNVVNPTSAQDAATKTYVDSLAAASGFPITNYNGDLNSINPGIGKQSVVLAISPATNRPISVEGYTITWGHPTNATILFQIFIARTQQSIYTRQCVTSTWSSWIAFAGGEPGVEFQGDASVVKLGGASPQTQVFNVPITTNRTFTASLTNADPGHKFRVLRSAACTGAFTITVKSSSGTTLATLRNPSDWADIEFDGTDWRPTSFNVYTGTVTSVGLSLPAIFSVSGSPVTTSGTLTGTLATQTANQVFAGPTSGSAATPTFRSLVVADLPAISSGHIYANITGGSAAPTDQSLSSLLDTVVSSTQGTILYRSSSAWTSLAPGTSGQFLKTNGTGADPAWASISSGSYYERARVIPTTSTMTLTNGGGVATATDTTYGILLDCSASAGSHIRYMDYNSGVPGSTWTIIARMAPVDPQTISSAGYHCCVVLRNSTSSRVIVMGTFQTQILIQSWTNLDSFSANIYAPVNAGYIAGTPWMRVVNNGTTLTFAWSPDGIAFKTIATTNLSTFITAAGGTVDKIGVGVMGSSAGGVTDLIQSFEIF